MKNMLMIGVAASILIGAAAPALAAAGSALPAGQVPYCSSTTAQDELSRGVYQDELQRGGATLQSIEIWNGCVRASYLDSSGHASTAIYDPDTLQLLTTLGTAANVAG